MAKKIEKKSDMDFTLISNKTKQRIRGLIEKRLTPKTIILFAQEYESYEKAVREELIKYIEFLLKQEEENFIRESSSYWQDPRLQIIQERKKIEFTEKQQNIKKIQDYLISTNIKKFVAPLPIKNNEIKKIEVTPIFKRYEIANKISEQNKKTSDAPSKVNNTTIPTVKKNNTKVKNKQVNLKNISATSLKSSSVEPKKITKSKPTIIDNNKNSKIDFLLKEAQQREAEEIRIKKEQEEKNKQAEEQKNKEILEQNAIREKLLKEKQESAKLAKQKKLVKKVNSENIIKLEKQKKPEIIIKPVKSKYEQKLLASSFKESNSQGRNYLKEQEEKEKLWKELYGKTREETLKERKDSNINIVNELKTSKKLVNFDTEELTEFKVLNNTFLIEEYIDPKSKYFNFWKKMRKKYKMSNITVWLSLNGKKHKKILKKRLKLEKKLGKKNIALKSSNNTKSASSQSFKK
ncbi:hypothetical protein [Spiroplasma taiwanense]|uniref:Uncharacterized protein n=1 Tax=Spiroplasma taiwanense CT-1 TaxID=1276220 RepID=S5MB59_9MOLU|nr:hypothetical protein [Spiroplasma taiwanense]AGR41008.1 hypothetical protein STAIW_v1c03500 [Spiroplasma taiwanense CT-1]